MRLFAKQWLVFVVVLKQPMYAQQMPAGSYQDILKNTLGLPPEMRTAIGEKSGRAISFREDSMVMYRPVAQATVRGGALTAAILSGIKPNFIKQLEWLMSFSSLAYDGPNYQGIAIKSIQQFGETSVDNYWGEDSEIVGSDIVLFDIATGKVVSNNLIPGFNISGVAIAPENNHVIAYAGKANAMSKQQTIYWTDLKNKKDIKVATFDMPIKRLQFYNDNKLYTLCNERLYLFDITESGATTSDQTVKDAKGNELLMEDFVLNKTDSNLAAAIMNSGLYVLNMKTKKFKKINELPTTLQIRRLAFYDNQIGIVSRLGDGSMHVVVIEPGLYSISE